MGSFFEYNWILKLSGINSKELKLETDYRFKKKGMRIYPINMPIDLVNANWEAIARCMISSISISSDYTEGVYSILEIYDENKKRVLSEQWKKFSKSSS